MRFVANIGLETHVQLKTKSKIFCGCPNEFGGEPNTHVCPVCLGYPGTLPTLNEEAVRLTVITGLLIGAQINPFSRFDRKNYFYPDMPKNYQISQYDRPLCTGGAVEIEVEGRPKTIGIIRIHLEEDVAKSLHFPGYSGVDFNRAGAPLMEIVTAPDLASPEEAHAFLVALKQILLYGGVSDCNLEQGNLRCDVNCSVRPEGAEQFGTKIEIKNLNTFKGVYHALKYELERQMSVLRSGGALTQETRRWNAELGVTEPMRTKEYAHDYRYFPEPDLMPVALDEQTIARWRAELPELPRARRERLIREYQIPAYDAGVLVADKPVADFFEETAKLSGNAKAASNWVMTEIRRVLSEREVELRDLPITPAALAGLIQLVDQGSLNMPSAREVFAELVEKGGDPAEIMRRRGLAQVSDTAALEALADEVIRENPGPAADYRNGRTQALQFLVGQLMRKSRGKANPRLVQELLQKKLQ